MKVIVKYKDGKEEEYIRASGFKSEPFLREGFVVFYTENEKVMIHKSKIQSVTQHDFAY